MLSAGNAELVRAFAGTDQGVHLQSESGRSISHTLRDGSGLEMVLIKI